jgi:outer membrane lipoprotein carrier protein
MVMEGIRGRYGNARGLTAHYTRDAISKTMALLGTTERHDTAEGTLYFKPPHLLRLDQVKPQEELLVTDGETLWWYLPLRKEVYHYSAEKFGQELRLLSDILKGLKDSQDRFQVALKESSEATTHRLVLTPDPPWEEIDYLEVVTGKGDFTIQQVDIYNKIGGITRFLLSDWKERDRFSADFFSFSPPPGAKIIDQ